ncbi:MAG TPA: nucleotidyltransferase domain-containing protein [Reyranella sp.]|nr:nucleotidyltransferase domain-containing protein [Reyranella sp.]
MATPDLALVREFKRRAEQALPGRIVRVMLYGSRARGDARDNSDWDVAVFLKGEPAQGPARSFGHRFRSDDGVRPTCAGHRHRS